MRGYWHPLLGERAGVRGERHKERFLVEWPDEKLRRLMQHSGILSLGRELA